MRKVICLASKKDTKYVREFEVHTALMRHQGMANFQGTAYVEDIAGYDATQLAEFDGEMQDAVVIGLLTPEMLAQVDMNPWLSNLLNRLRVLETSCIVPLPIRVSSWKRDTNPFKGLRALTFNGEPIQAGNRDEQWDGAVGLLRALLSKRA